MDLGNMLRITGVSVMITIWVLAAVFLILLFICMGISVLKVPFKCHKLSDKMKHIVDTYLRIAVGIAMFSIAILIIVVLFVVLVDAELRIH